VHMRGKLTSPARLVDEQGHYHHITVAAIGIMLAMLVASIALSSICAERDRPDASR
jgi:hypothetical protein